MTSAGRDILTAGTTATGAARERERATVATDALLQRPAPDIAEAKARRSARRLAFVLMACSSLLTIAILAGVFLWWHATP